MAFNQSVPRGFSVKKTYMTNILRDQAKSIVKNEDGEMVAHSNPVQGVPPSAPLVKPSQPSSTQTERRTIGLSTNNQPAPFRMRKTFYAYADR